MTHPTLTDHQLQDLATRYVEVWNEPDARLRQARVEALWAPGGVHFVRTLVARGPAALHERVTGSHERNVRQRGCRFRASGQAQQVQDGVLLHWDMVRPGSEALEAFGAAFLRLAPDGRIATDYQFVLPTPAEPGR